MACSRLSSWCTLQIARRCDSRAAFSRSFGTLPEQEDVFDRALKAAHRSRAAHAAGSAVPHDSFQRECAERLLDKLRDVTKHFTRVLVLGGAGHMFTQMFLDDEKSKQIQHISYIDQSWAMANRFQEALQQRALDSGRSFNVQLADEEFIPFPDKSFDLVVACNSLHWVNDLERTFAECRRVLQPDGMFLASVLGGDTLRELRNACHLAEEEREGGFSLRTSPLVHVRDAGILLSGAKFTLQTVDIDDIIVQYEDVADAITHLRANSEQNAAIQRRQELPRDTAIAGCLVPQWELYQVGQLICGALKIVYRYLDPQQMYLAAAIFAHGQDATKEGGITSTFQLICCSGWAPDFSQQRPSKRGSAGVSMKDIPVAKAG